MKKVFPLPNEETITRDKILTRINLKKANNPNYSIRLVAKKAEINSGTLSAYLKGDRNLDVDTLSKLLHILGFTPLEVAECLSATKQAIVSDASKPNKVPVKNLTDGELQLLRSINYFGLLSAIELTESTKEPAWFEKKLGIPQEEIRQMLEVFKKLDLIEEEEHRYKRTYLRLTTPDDAKNDLGAQMHQQLLEKAKWGLQNIPVKERDLTFLVMPVNTSKIQEAKALIRDFQDKMMDLLETDEKSEVYLMATHLLPFKTQK